MNYEWNPRPQIWIKIYLNSNHEKLGEGWIVNTCLITNLEIEIYENSDHNNLGEAGRWVICQSQI